MSDSEYEEELIYKNRGIHQPVSKYSNDYGNNNNGNDYGNNNNGNDYSNELEEDFNDFKNDVITSTIIPKPNIETHLVDYYVYINSKDRNIDMEDTAFNFNISFNNLASGIKIITALTNVVKIELLELIMPDFYTNIDDMLFLYSNTVITSKSDADSKNIRTQRLRDLQYLQINLENMSNDNVVGTNNSINKSSFIMKLDDKFISSNQNSGYYTPSGITNIEVGNINNSILAGTDKHILRYRPSDNCSINYRENEMPKLANITFSVRDTLGNIFNYFNDTLSLSTITYNSTNKLFRLDTTELFSSDEYSLGDKILINSATITDTSIRKDDLVSFLTRPEGHIIASHHGNAINDPISATINLFKGFYIAMSFNIDKTSTITNVDVLFPKNTFGLTNNTGIDITNSKLINLNNQCTVAFKFTCIKNKIA
jgi:hypothetical protein